MKTRLKIYLGHAISGLSYEQVASYYINMSNTLTEMGFDVMHPMLGKGNLRTEKEFRAHGYGNPESTNHAIKSRDKWMVKHADVILMDYTDAPMPSIGMASELAWGEEFGKQCVVVVQEGNPNYHAFVLENATVVYDDIQDALKYLNILQNGDTTL